MEPNLAQSIGGNRRRLGSKSKSSEPCNPAANYLVWGLGPGDSDSRDMSHRQRGPRQSGDGSDVVPVAGSVTETPSTRNCACSGLKFRPQISKAEPAPSGCHSSSRRPPRNDEISRLTDAHIQSPTAMGTLLPGHPGRRGSRSSVACTLLSQVSLIHHDRPVVPGELLGFPEAAWNAYQ